MPKGSGDLYLEQFGEKQKLLVTEEAPEGLAGGCVAQEGSQGTVWLRSQRGDLRCAGNETW